MFAQKFPEGTAVLLHCQCCAANIPLVRAQNARKKIVLESPNHTCFRHSKRLTIPSSFPFRQAKIRRFDLLVIGHYDSAHQHVLEFAYITGPRMTNQAVERGKREIFRPALSDRSRFLQKVLSE